MWMSKSALRGEPIFTKPFLIIVGTIAVVVTLGITTALMSDNRFATDHQVGYMIEQLKKAEVGDIVWAHYPDNSRRIFLIQIISDNGIFLQDGTHSIPRAYRIDEFAPRVALVVKWKNNQQEYSHFATDFVRQLTSGWQPQEE